MADFPVTIAAGATSGAGTFTLTPVDDGLAEGDEALSLGGSASGLTVAGAEVTITDDDVLEASVRASAARVNEGGTASFTVELTGGTSTAAVELTYTVGGTATADEDYPAPSGTLTIGAGMVEETIRIETLSDDL